MTPELLTGLAITALLLLTAYLAAVETVVTRVDVVRAIRLREEGVRGGDALLWLTEHRATALSVILVATVSARVTLAALAALLGWQELGGIPGAALAVAMTVVASLVVGEVVPRTVVLRSLEPVSGALAGSGRALVRALQLPARAIVGVARALVPRRHEVSGPYASDDELRELDVVEEEQDEELEPEERAMIRSIFELAETRVREVMVPRPDIVAAAANASLDDLVALITEHGVSRVPVHEPEDADTVVGIVYAKDLLKRVAADRRRRWADLVREPTFVPETKRCDELLRDLQEAAVHLAMVVDEYGELVGLVTIEDVLEEIVGEIVDEHDQVEPLVDVLDDGGWRVDARLGVDDLNELLETALPEEGWDTVGGLVFGTLGRVPVEGERVELDGVRLTVERVQGRRVAKVVVVRTEPSYPANDPAS